MEKVRAILFLIFIGIVVAFGGLLITIILVEFVFTGVSEAAAAMFGWGMYLCCVIVVCTGTIIRKKK